VVTEVLDAGGIAIEKGHRLALEEGKGE